MCEAAHETVPNEDEPVLRLARAAAAQYDLTYVVVTRS